MIFLASKDFRSKGTVKMISAPSVPDFNCELPSSGGSSQF
jgi:hypothetical protein